MEFFDDINLPNSTDFVYFCVTSNNYEENFFLRDTFFCRFNANIVEHSNSRLLISHLPKNLEELLTIWPFSTNVKGQYNIFYINESLLNDSIVLNIIKKVQFGCIFVPENISEAKISILEKNANVPLVSTQKYSKKENILPADKNVLDNILKVNKENILKLFPDWIFKENFSCEKTTLKPVKIPSVNFLLPIGALINRNRGLYQSSYDNRELVAPNTSDTYETKEQEAIKWNLVYLKQFLVEKYILLNSIHPDRVDNLISKLPNDVVLFEQDDLKVSELIYNFEYLTEYYQINFEEVNYKTDMIFYLPMVNKFVVEKINNFLEKDKLPKKILRKLYDETGYYGVYSPGSNTDKEELYMGVFFSALKTKAEENRVIDSLFVNFSLGSIIPYLRLSNVPASNIYLWYSHMQKNVLRNNELLQVEKFNESKIKIGNLLRSIVGEEIINLIFSHGKHVKFITDAPVEWIENDGIPIGIEKSISRLPVVPGNGLVAHTYIQHFQLSYKQLRVLIIHALNIEDPLYKFGKGLEELYKKQLVNFEEKLFYKEPVDKNEYIKYLEEIQPTILVFYGHGSFDYNEDEGKLHIRDDSITATELEMIHWNPIITILGACETQTLNNNYLNIGNMLIGSGSASVLATYFPVDGMFTFSFLEGLFRHLLNTLRNESPKRLIKSWADVILQTRRTHYLIEPIEVIKRYFKIKNIDFDFDKVEIGKFVVDFCMNKIKYDISDAYRYRNDAYRSYFDENKGALEAFEYILKHNYIFHESLIFTSLGSPEQIEIIRLQ